MNELRNQPIGFFDSGVGGLSIWQDVNELLPFERTIYLADSKNAPYGDKDKETIIGFSIKNTERLLNAGCKIIVVACNTATTNAIAQLRSTFNVPFIGIEPATKPAAINTQTGKIGILATKGTLASELFLNTSKQYRSNIQIFETIGTGLVQIIESGDIEASEPLLRSYIEPMIDAGVDNIVLGCTHYPFLKPVLQKFVPSNVTIIDSGAAVAKQTKNILEHNNLLSQFNYRPLNHFETNSNPLVLKGFLNRLRVSNYNIEAADF